MADFDPNAAAFGDNIYGLPYDVEQASQVIIPVPWEATVSYGMGAAEAPEAVLQASKQVDLYDPDVPDAWRLGLAMDAVPAAIVEANTRVRKDVEKHLEALEAGGAAPEVLAKINEECDKVNKWVRTRSKELLDQGKLVYVLGGDHSAPLGLLQELAARGEFGILHFDAHADLRIAYEGFEYSHASIMYNVQKLPGVTAIAQVGIRDFCEEEVQVAMESGGRIKMFTDREIQSRLFEGEPWKRICKDIIDHLPQRVYVSFDIDGLDPMLCPGTGTPVPGGLQFEQSLYLIREVVRSGRTLIGFDLCEVSPTEDDEWDANVGARLLYRMANLVAHSNRLQPVS
jgi:agmatinase